MGGGGGGIKSSDTEICVGYIWDKTRFSCGRKHKVKEMNRYTDG